MFTVGLEHWNEANPLVTFMLLRFTFDDVISGKLEKYVV